VLRDHPLVAAEALGVLGGAAEDLAPPRGDVGPVLLPHAAGEERRQQVVTLDAVVERVDEPPEGRAAARPVVEGRRHGLHGVSHV
jgi:hypothetical protein